MVAFSPGVPLARGKGMASGRCGARFGNHRCSLSTCRVAFWIRGSRTAMSSPSRKIALSVPAECTGLMGRSAHCGNCAESNRTTRDTSMFSSSTCILPGSCILYAFVTLVGVLSRNFIRIKGGCQNCFPNGDQIYAGHDGSSCPVR